MIGTSVTGELLFDGDPAELLDPANLEVPGGYLNTAGTTVTISDPAVEFGFQDAHKTVHGGLHADSGVTFDLQQDQQGGNVDLSPSPGTFLLTRQVRAACQPSVCSSPPP